MDEPKSKGLFYILYVIPVLYVVLTLYIYGKTNKHRHAV